MATRTHSSAPSGHSSRFRKPATTAEQLAKDLEDLSINNGKGKQKAREQESDSEAKKLASMRAVNGASQTLSNVVQSGWKNLAGRTVSKTALNTVVSSAAEAAKHLGVLRRISPGDIDVERAASSVLGKLLVLEMFDLAFSSLEDMHPRICLAINGSEGHQTTGSSKLYLLSVPKSASPLSNSTVLNLLSTYLLYALMLVSRPESSTPSSVQQLSTTLDSPSTSSLLSWLPDFSILPSKHLDSLLTRAYAALTKLCNSSIASKKPPLKSKSTNPPTSPSPEALFSLRMCALRCLAHTSTGVIEGKNFWDQATKFTNVLVKAVPSSTSEERITGLVLRALEELVQIAETRPDKGTFMTVDENGKNFIAFCDCWSSFAKRAGDISLLQKINLLIQRSAPSSIPFHATTLSPKKQVEAGKSTQQLLIIDGTKLCNTFAQLSLLLEDLMKARMERAEENDDQLLSLIQVCKSSFETPSHICLFLRPTFLQSTPSAGAEELDRIRAKVDRAVEKVRRLATKAIDVYSSSPSSLPAIFPKVNEHLHCLLRACVACLQVVLLDSTLDAPAIRDILHRSIDTLFVMARVTLKVTDPRTFIPAFELLFQGTSILDSIPVNDSPPSALREESFDIANYARCISGAFYNLASILYQSTRYGNAVPFLLESCTLGGRALSLPRSAPESTTETRRKEWTQLEEQFYRRWELLGVCYSKNSDRRKAFDAFKQAIATFPFSSTGLSEQTETLAIDALFGSECNTAAKQLAGLVDRVTYMGTCELFLPPEAVSFRSCLQNPNGHHNEFFHLEAGITGALLERQLVGLEPSRWKDGVRTVFIGLLRDAIEVYSVQVEDGSLLMPIRKARVLCRCLEFAYRDSAVDGISSLGYGTAEEVATEIERLCTLQSFAKDSSLAHFSLQYRAAAHLWVALHAHRRAEAEQNTIMTQRSEEACRLMKMILGPDTIGDSKISRGPTSPKLVRKSAGSARVGRIVSPKATRTTRLKVPSAPRKPAPVRKTKIKVVGESKAVKPKTTLAAQVTATNTVRRSLDGKTLTKIIVFDNFDEFLKLLQLVARILGLLSLILAKAHVLDVARKLAQHHLGTKSDGYILASLDLAHEYVTLGKLRRAVSIFSPAHDIVRSRQASREVSVRFLLRFGESLAMFEDIPKSVEVYLEAQGLSQHLELEEKGMSTRERVLVRVKNLEIAATAAHVFATIQFAQGDVDASLGSSLQALRVWNRAIETITRLRPSTSSTPDANPFEMTPLQNALPSTSQSIATPNESPHGPSFKPRRSVACELEWSLSEGLLSTLFFLNETYFLRGSPREAEYFARQAAELAEQLNAPPMACRALARLGEVQLHTGRFDDAHSSLTRAADRLQGMPGLDAADIRRLKMEYRMKTSEGDEPTELFEETVRMLEELDDAFQQFDSVAFGPRRSLGSSPGRKMLVDVLAPALLSSILSQQLWVLRNDIGDRFDSILERFLSLSFSNATKAEENALMANLTLHSVYGRFRTDMFLSSLTESTIAVPIGMKIIDETRSSVSSVDVLDALVKAEKHLSAHLHMSASTGSIIKIRETVISLVLVYAFGTSLGDRREDLPFVIASLLDASASLTLRHDMLDAIDHKFPPTLLPDDFRWPSPQPQALPPPRAPFTKKRRVNPSLSESDDDDDDDDESFVKEYWQSLRQKYKTQILDPRLLSSPETATLPSNWTVVNVSVTPDKSTLFCCRREGGDHSDQPLIFCIPLKERREQPGGDGEGDHLTFDSALSELQDIIHTSNESTKAAIHIKSDDETARSNWWKQRGQLDVRMRELLENIEYCWLGAFKTILSPRSEMPAEMISELCEHFEKVFHRNLRMKDKKAGKPKQRKCASQTHVPGQFKLDEAFVKCFSTLSPKCRDEELEDIVYFVLDLYQYHGVPVAVSEVDIDQLVVDLRTVLEDYSAKQLRQRSFMKTTPRPDDHLFLILDKNVQGIPWESLPILRGRSVSRIPGVQFLHDRILFAQRKQEAAGRKHDPVDGAVIDPRKGFFILNPSGDLSKTEDRFRDWANGMRAAGWNGITGQPITEQHFIDALRSNDLVIYFGHGGGEQYVRSHRIRNLPTCAATMLWGCSSGVLRDLGDFDRTGTPYNYMLAGCPTLVANLWDVTDKDIDKLCQAVLDKMSLNGPDIARQSGQSTRQPFSLVSAVAQARDSCKLKYLTGAAPVVYGIPFYL